MTRLITFRFPKIKRRKKQPKYRRTSECVPKGNNSTHISYIPCELMRIHVRSRVRVFHVRAFHMCILLLLCCCCEGGRDDIVDSTHHRCLHECVFQILCCVLWHWWWWVRQSPFAMGRPPVASRTNQTSTPCVASAEARGRGQQTKKKGWENHRKCLNSPLPFIFVKCVFFAVASGHMCDATVIHKWTGCDIVCAWPCAWIKGLSISRVQI